MGARQVDSTDIQARAAKMPRRFLDIDGVTTDCKRDLMLDRRQMKAVNVRDSRGAADLILAVQGPGR